MNDTFKRATFHPKVKAIFKELNFEVPEVVQSMYIFKVGSLRESNEVQNLLKFDKIYGSTRKLQSFENLLKFSNPVSEVR